MNQTQDTQTNQNTNANDTDRRSKLYDIATAHDMSDQQADELVHLFMERFPHEPAGSTNTPSRYVDEWIDRIKSGRAMNVADAETKKVLRGLRWTYQPTLSTTATTPAKRRRRTPTLKLLADTARTPRSSFKISHESGSYSYDRGWFILNVCWFWFILNTWCKRRFNNQKTYKLLMLLLWPMKPLCDELSVAD